MAPKVGKNNTYELKLLMTLLTSLYWKFFLNSQK